MDIGTVSAYEVGSMLYRLQFPNKDFRDLPEEVRTSYRLDGERMLQMLREVTRG